MKFQYESNEHRNRETNNATQDERNAALERRNHEEEKIDQCQNQLFRLKVKKPPKEDGREN